MSSYTTRGSPSHCTPQPCLKGGPHRLSPEAEGACSCSTRRFRFHLDRQQLPKRRLSWLDIPRPALPSPAPPKCPDTVHCPITFPTAKPALFPRSPCSPLDCSSHQIWPVNPRPSWVAYSTTCESPPSLGYINTHHQKENSP